MPDYRHALVVVWLGGLILALTPRAAAAQTNERTYEDLDFRFVTPGARAVGMGKTFVGLADDATAAASNPAGLSNLLEPEVSFEFSGTKIRHERVVATDPIKRTQTFGDFVPLPSFGSAVFPLGQATIAGFINSMQGYSEHFMFDGRKITPTKSEDGDFGFIDVGALNFGASGSYVCSSWLSIGGSIVATRLWMQGESHSGSPAAPKNGSVTDDAALSWSGFAGVLVKPARGVAIGAAYYGSEHFDLNTTISGNFWLGGNDQTARYVSPEEGKRTIEYVIPTRYSLGTSWRINDAVTIAADASRVLYSQRVTDKFLIVDFSLVQNNALGPDNFWVPDVTEYHLGGEYRAFRHQHALSLRAGLYTNPDHQMRYQQLARNHRDDVNAHEVFRFNSTPGKTRLGGTVGAGLTFWNAFQMDLAGSYTHDSWEVVASVVRRFR